MTSLLSLFKKKNKKQKPFSEKKLCVEWKIIENFVIQGKRSILKWVVKEKECGGVKVEMEEEIL